MSRRLELPSIANLRDLGGLRGRDGRFPSGVVLRSGSLALATTADADVLRSRLGVRTLVDLRSAREVERDGELSPPLGGTLRRLWVPFADEEPFLSGIADPSADDYLQAYRRLARASGPAVTAVLAAAVAEGRGVLVACTAGKDRTGVVCGLVLAAAGVKDGEIARDYALTARCLRARLESFRPHWERKRLTPFQYARRLETQPRTMLRLLAALRAEHGSHARALHAAGVQPELVHCAQAMLVPRN